jgi:hypothetical protein
MAICAIGGPALAHHSGATIDYSKQIKLEGTVIDWQFTNPHSWLDVMVVYPNGQSEKWPFETGSINGLIRHGWNSKSLKPGDKVTVVAFPLRSGDVGGRLASVTKDDGKAVGQALGSDN